MGELQRMERVRAEEQKGRGGCGRDGSEWDSLQMEIVGENREDR